MLIVVHDRQEIFHVFESNTNWKYHNEEMTFSMKNAFIKISNDDRDVLQQERNTNLANILTNG